MRERERERCIHVIIETGITVPRCRHYRVYFHIRLRRRSPLTSRRLLLYAWAAVQKTAEIVKVRARYRDYRRRVLICPVRTDRLRNSRRFPIRVAQSSSFPIMYSRPIARLSRRNILRPRVSYSRAWDVWYVRGVNARTIMLSYDPCSKSKRVLHIDPFNVALTVSRNVLSGPPRC